MNCSICIKASTTLPVGYIVYHTGNIGPQGFLPADGSMVSKAQYPELYEVIGDVYGSSVSSFCLPNIVGVDVEPMDYCVVCKVPVINHYPTDNHPFFKNNLEYIEWQYEKRHAVRG